MTEEHVISFKTNDDMIITTTKRIAEMSITIKNLIEDLGYDNTSPSEEDAIPLQSINSTTLKFVLDYCQHHVDDKPKAWEIRYPDTLDSSEPWGWDGDFVNQFSTKDTIPQLFDIISAANYLDNKKLLNLCCKKVAYIIKDKNTDEIRDMFGLENDFGDEWENVKNESAWCE